MNCACARASLGQYTVHTMTIDGRTVPQSYVETRLLSVDLPPDNVFQISDTHAQSVGAAWVVLLPPLRPGRHTIVIHDEGDGAQTVDSTTTIVVQHCR
jgi:hypothetical protein